MRLLKHSEEEVLLAMLKLYTAHCSKMQQRWRKSVAYHEIFNTWQDAKDKATEIVDRVLEDDEGPPGW